MWYTSYSTTLSLEANEAIESFIRSSYSFKYSIFRSFIAFSISGSGSGRDVIDRGRQRRLLTICAAAAFSSVDYLTHPLALPLSKGARQERWEKQRMIERAEEGQGQLE